jgi:hypothetical protein
LKGRQNSFVGVGRFDLLFEDSHGTHVLMELKARPAKYEDADQLARYKEELERRGTDNVVMWLIAPAIPGPVRQFLDRIGIEHTEIHESEFRRVAQRHGTSIKSETEVPHSMAAAAEAEIAPRRIAPVVPRSGSVETGPTVILPSKLAWRAYGFDLMLANPDIFEHEHFKALVDTFEEAVPSRKNAGVVAALRTWATNVAFSRLPHGTCCSLLRWVTTSGWRDAVPHAEVIWNYLFGKPVPTWYVWDQSRRKYEFDASLSNGAM